MRPPQVQSRKAQVQKTFHKRPTVRFEDRKLISSSGLPIFQVLFSKINLKMSLKDCFKDIKISPVFGRYLLVLLPVVHPLLGFPLLLKVDYFGDDPLALRLISLLRLRGVSTISRALFQI
jgi:hypothetical protein